MYGLTSSAFLALFEGPSRKTDGLFSNQFKSWLNDVDSEFKKKSFKINDMTAWKNLVFRMLELYLNLEQSWLSDNERILDHFWRSQKKNWCHILKSGLQVG